MNAEKGLCECGCGQKTTIPIKNSASLGRIRGLPMRFISGHNSTKPIQYRIDKKTGCWFWMLAKTIGGYGKKKVNGEHLLAHRFYFMKAKGPIQKDFVIDHLCARQSCVNPDHLESVSRLENLNRRDRRLGWGKFRK